jgi:hypothetical protein
MHYHYFTDDLVGERYEMFVERMLYANSTFSLVWRDQLRFAESASSVRESLRPLQVDYFRVDRWPGTRLFHRGKATVVHFRCDPRAHETLVRPGSLFSWLAPALPEDLAFYSEEGVATFASVSHDREAFVLSAPLREVFAGVIRLAEDDAAADTVPILLGV